MMYNFQDRSEFNKSNKMLDLTPVKEITSFFQLLYREHENDGTLKEKEHEKLKKGLRKELKEEFAAACKKGNKRAFLRDQNSNGCSCGYY